MDLPAELLKPLQPAGTPNTDPIQMFWFGDPMPSAHQVCLKTWVKQGYTPQLWCYDAQAPIAGVEQRDAAEVLPRELADHWAAMPVPHAKQTFANFFRYLLMYRIGRGWWADTDLVCLSRLTDFPASFTWTNDIKTRPELRELFPTLPEFGGNILNTVFRISHLDQPWLLELCRQLWPGLAALECPAFGQTGTIAFTTAIYQNYRVPPLRPMIGNCWRTRYRLFEDPSWTPPAWATLLHLYNFTNPRPETAVPGSCWQRMLERFSEAVHN